ncbi:U3 small nucleolar ribonucleoprotein protein [Pseudozyma hubeiensis SY62]|uniref:U3 small nucleolar ribonucleoprotein protein n=1 Tax=Pseudozyma hubeiensis (strain SY62) TaxID=1305764 RepID=R9PE21_PSEHS|nr:U3 small nucleolar ribonucleoprotein protein [Pseudozyma hubeiensis SY62]GAC99497.1 U3 small nucleolar ribonucleoprotein protein [Pseudozyma hubeiensis SY62]
MKKNASSRETKEKLSERCQHYSTATPCSRKRRTWNHHRKQTPDAKQVCLLKRLESASCVRRGKKVAGEAPTDDRMRSRAPTDFRKQMHMMTLVTCLGLGKTATDFQTRSVAATHTFAVDHAPTTVAQSLSNTAQASLLR